METHPNQGREEVIFRLEALSGERPEMAETMRMIGEYAHGVVDDLNQVRFLPPTLYTPERIKRVWKGIDRLNVDTGIRKRNFLKAHGFRRLFWRWLDSGTNAREVLIDVLMIWFFGLVCLGYVKWSTHVAHREAIGHVNVEIRNHWSENRQI